MKVVDKYEELKNEPDWSRLMNMKKTAGAIFRTSPSNVQQWWKGREPLRALQKACRAAVSKTQAESGAQVRVLFPDRVSVSAQVLVLSGAD